MKVRFDFVTNSSSSSFVICRINNKVLADLYRKAGLNSKIDPSNSDVVRDQFENDMSNMSGPNGGSITEWLKNSIVLDYFAGNHTEYKKLMELLADHKEEVDYGTSDADFDNTVIISDGDGSHYVSEERRGGRISFTGFGDENWDYKAEGEPIFEFLSSDPGVIKGKAKELCETFVSRDPWFIGKGSNNSADANDDITSQDEEENSINDTIKKLLDSIDQFAVDPEKESFYMKVMAFSFYKINGEGVYSKDSDRYSNIDKSFLDGVRPDYIDSDYTPEYVKELVEEEKNKKWGEHLTVLYKEALNDIGVIAQSSLSSNSDYVVIADSPDAVINHYEVQNYIYDHFSIIRYNHELEQIANNYKESIKKQCYISYLKTVLDELNRINNDRAPDRDPLSVVWESQLYSFLMEHSSLGGVDPEKIIGKNGTVRLKIPEDRLNDVDKVLSELVARWPGRVINPKTRTYIKIIKALESINGSIGYANANEFFDAYGFSVQQETTTINGTVYKDFEYIKHERTNEITISKYYGKDSSVSVPDEIEGCAVKTIGKEAFCNNKYIEEVIVPDTVETIRAGAFKFCDKLKRVRLSNSVDKIVAGSFDGCSSLQEINIPDGVSELPDKLFRDCPIKELHIGKSLSDINRTIFYKGEPEEKNDFFLPSVVETITVDPENKYLTSNGSMVLACDGKVLLAMLGNEASCVVPDGVEVIYDNTFAFQSSLEAVTLPDSLVIIGNYAFRMTGLKHISFPSSLTSIGQGAFISCWELTTVVFNEGLERIYNEAFIGTNMESISLPASLKELGSYAIEYWRMNDNDAASLGRYKLTSKKSLGTQEFVNQIKHKSKQKEFDLLLENKVGFGLLALMMAWLRSEAANAVTVKDRLDLEKIVISKEMESMLGTDLGRLLKLLRGKSTEELKKCIDYLKDGSDNQRREEVIAEIRTKFKDRSGMSTMLNGVISQINGGVE